MDKTQGNMIGFASRYKQAGDKRPNFEGRITLPETDREFRMALWASKDKNQRVMFSGRVADISASDSAIEQIGTMAGVGIDAKAVEENGLKLEPGQLVFFTNTYKDEANPNRPDFYGRWNPGSGNKLVTVSVWARKSRTGQALLTGQTQYPQPGRNAATVDAPMDLPTEDVAFGETTPRKRAGRGSR